METHIAKWGNSFGVRLPKSVMKELSLKEGVSLKIALEGNKILLEPKTDNKVKLKRYDLEKMLKAITPDMLHDGLEDEPVGAEIW